MRKYLSLVAALLALIASPAAADWTAKNAAGTTITFSNPVDCTSGTCIPIAALVNASGGTAYGTAGTANAAVITVQGIASMTPMASNITQVLGAANSASNGLFVRTGSGQIAAGSLAAGAGVDGWDLTQGAIADAAVTAGATGSVSAKLRSISRDVMTTNTWAGGTLGAMATYGTSPGAVLVPGVNAYVTNTIAAVGNNSDNVAAGAGAASPVANYNYAFDGTTWDRVRAVAVDPCEATAQSYAPISITTATTTRIVAPSASNKTYICSLFLTSAAADNVGIVEGTGGTCGTGTAGVIGGTTAANGPNFAANGGVMLQAGGKVAVAQTAGTNVDLCLITSAATPLAGGIKYVQAP